MKVVTRPALAMLLIASLALPAAAQQGAVKLAIADASRIFNEMQETKDLKQSLEEERGRLAAQEKEKRTELEKLQAQRNQSKPDSPSYDKLNDDLMDAALDFQQWGQQTKVKAERNQKRQMKSLFTKIERSIGEVAERDGYDLVLAAQQPELPENLDQINFDQLRALINTRNVLYASPKADISESVIALLDSQYKGKSPAAAPVPKKTTPAPKK